MNELKPHVHADLIPIYAGQLASGEIAAGWWLWESSFRHDKWLQLGDLPIWSQDCQYRYSKTDKHPDNRKLKLVDMSKLPVGAKVRSTITGSIGEYRCFLHENGRQIVLWETGGAFPVSSIKFGDVRIAPSDWIGNPEGCDTCPVPEGLTYEVMLRSGCKVSGSKKALRWAHLDDDGDIIFYRITGLADGWTDDPEKAK